MLITGGGIGIGRATAFEGAKARYHVIVTDVLESAGVEVARAIVATGGSADFEFLDVRSTEAVNAVVARVEQRCGAIDALVLNAGIAHRAPLSEMSDAQWDQTMEINLKGMLRVARAALPGMRTRGSGSITALSSDPGLAHGRSEPGPSSRAKARAPAAGSRPCPRSWAWPTDGASMCITRRPRPACWAWCGPWRSNWRARAFASMPSHPAMCARRKPCRASTRSGLKGWRLRQRSFRSAASANPTTSPARSCFFAATRHATSPARPWWWTAACSWGAIERHRAPSGRALGVWFFH